jgi:ABC-type branched-subunit amino acid transport system substrate-binding protein
LGDRLSWPVKEVNEGGGVLVKDVVVLTVDRVTEPARAREEAREERRCRCFE